MEQAKSIGFPGRGGRGATFRVNHLIDNSQFLVK